MKIRRLLVLLLLLPLLISCSVNPVTGKKELMLISEQQELAVGRKNYGPYRQAQGGDYVADPALTAYVQRVGQRLAAVSDRKLPYEFRVVNDSTPNAWALPGGKIAVNRGLLEKLDNEAELAAVLGHEIVHAAARHTAQSMQRGIFLQGALLATGVALGDSRYRQLGMLGTQIGAQLVQSHYGRDAEREADAYGMRYMARAGYDPAAAVELQELFLKLFKDKEPGWLGGLFASHPPSAERVRNNRRVLAELGNPGGELGRARYQRAIAHLKKVQPAYEAYAQARKAMRDKDWRRARGLLDRAIRIEPKEALFWLARGELDEQQGRSRRAGRDFDRAVALNPDYFMPLLKRGLWYREQGRLDAARRDLAASVDKLPTVEGTYGLGLVAQAQGQQEQAIHYFQLAARAQGPVAKVAATRLARLDMPQHPGRYLLAQLLLDPQGRLLLRLSNRSALPVSGLRVVIGRRVGAVFQEGTRLRVSGVLGAGETRTLATGLGPLDAARARGLAAEVVSARPAGVAM